MSALFTWTFQSHMLVWLVFVSNNDVRGTPISVNQTGAFQFDSSSRGSVFMLVWLTACQSNRKNDHRYFNKFIIYGMTRENLLSVEHGLFKTVLMSSTAGHLSDPRQLSTDWVTERGKQKKKTWHAEKCTFVVCKWLSHNFDVPIL